MGVALSDRGADTVRWLEAREAAMLALLAVLVNIDSNSYEEAGVDAAAARIGGFSPSMVCPSPRSRSQDTAMR